MHSKIATSIFALATVLSGSAYAADVYHSGMKDEAGAAVSDGSHVFNWTGFYVGGQAGGTFLILGDEDGKGGLSVDGFTGGGVLGFDYARGRVLFGISAEYNFSNAGLEVGPFEILEKDHDLSGCARVGYIAAPRTLVYGKGCYTQIELTAGPILGGGSETFDGIGARGGIEFATTGNVFLGIEAGHTWFDEGDKLPSGVSLDETTIMGTLKVKLNSGLGGWSN